MTKIVYKMVDKSGNNLLWNNAYLDSYQKAIDWVWEKRYEFQLIRMHWELTLTDIPSIKVWTYVFEVID